LYKIKEIKINEKFNNNDDVNDELNAYADEKQACFVVVANVKFFSTKDNEPPDNNSDGSFY
jgi:hypothetical protein